MASQATRSCIHCGGDIPQDAPSNHTTCSEECRKLGILKWNIDAAEHQINGFLTTMQIYQLFYYPEINRGLIGYQAARDEVHARYIAGDTEGGEAALNALCEAAETLKAAVDHLVGSSSTGT